MMVEKIRPRAEIKDCTNEDGFRTWKEIWYYCPKCGRLIGGYRDGVACNECGIFYDWGEKKPKLVATYNIEW